jgi:hypothetical protein
VMAEKSAPFFWLARGTFGSDTVNKQPLSR